MGALYKVDRTALNDDASWTNVTQRATCIKPTCHVTPEIRPLSEARCVRIPLGEIMLAPNGVQLRDICLFLSVSRKGTLSQLI